MFENFIKNATTQITQECDKRVERVINEVDERIKTATAEAYRSGYMDATEDVCRRLENLYTLGFHFGKEDGKADAGIIDIDDLDVDDDIAKALGEETA